MRDGGVILLERNTMESMRLVDNEKCSELIDETTTMDLIPGDEHGLCLHRTKSGVRIIEHASFFLISSPDTTRAVRVKLTGTYIVLFHLLQKSGNIDEVYATRQIQILQTLLMALEKDDDGQAFGFTMHRAFPPGFFKGPKKFLG